MGSDSGVPRQEDPQRQLEQAFIDEYVRAHGHDPARLAELPPELARPLLRDAIMYAATKLAEVESRAQYMHHLHGH